jgi:DNA-binding MarR family transcriptional regulator
MKIEEVIQQRVFKNERQKATVNVLYTNSWLTGHIKDFLKPYKITMQQFNVLRILRGQYPNNLSTNAIRDRMLDRSSDASRIVDRLFKNGMVAKKTCPDDRRLVDVKITNKGLNLLETIDEKMDEMEAVFGTLTNNELKTLNSLLDKLRS